MLRLPRWLTQAARAARPGGGSAAESSRAGRAGRRGGTSRQGQVRRCRVRLPVHRPRHRQRLAPPGRLERARRGWLPRHFRDTSERLPRDSRETQTCFSIQPVAPHVGRRPADERSVTRTSPVDLTRVSNDSQGGSQAGGRGVPRGRLLAQRAAAAASLPAFAALLSLLRAGRVWVGGEARPGLLRRARRGRRREGSTQGRSSPGSVAGRRWHGCDSA